MEMNLLFWCGVFVFTLFALIKCADYFIEYAEKVGLVFGIPQLVIGVTVVALGTSLPELASSIAAIYEGSSEIVLSNVMGSNITNVFLILGVLSLVGAGKKIAEKPPIHDTIFLFGSAAFLSGAIYDGSFALWEGVVCVAGLSGYMGFCVRESMKSESDDDKPQMQWYYIPIVLAAGVGIYFCAEYNIKSIINVADIVKVGAEVISASAVALGTSLPELIVSMSAVKKGKISLAIGNVLGSNIFNAFGVSGASRFFGDLLVPDLGLTFLMPMMLAGTVALFVFYNLKKLNVGYGIVLLAIYIFFLIRVVSLSL